MPERKKIAIAIPTYNSVPSNCFANFVKLFGEISQAYNYTTLIVDSTVVSQARNVLIETFLKTDADYLLFLDSDMIVSAPQIHAMVSADKDVISALAFSRGKNCIPSFRIKQNNDHFPVKNYPENALIEVSSVGMACCLIKRKVIEELIAKKKDGILFDIKLKSVGMALGEDIYFCDLLTKQGYKIFVHTGIVAQHFGGMIDEKYFDSHKNEAIGNEMNWTKKAEQ
ncbi:MAG: hypothetical protein Q7S21_06075 [archaeon]|nr:hypothetical protein [archaeon]